MSNTEYAPKPGSLAEKVISYFRNNTGKTLSIDEIRETWSVKGNVVQQLEDALARGWLVRAVHDLSIFMPGYKLAASMPADPSVISKPKPSSGTRLGAKRDHLPPLDLSTLKVEQGVEVPAHNVSRGESRWEPLLAKLTNVGDSMQLPEQYKGTVLTYTRKRLKSRPDAPERFKIGLDLKGQSRIWRIA